MQKDYKDAEIMIREDHTEAVPSGHDRKTAAVVTHIKPEEDQSSQLSYMEDGGACKPSHPLTTANWLLGDKESLL